MSNVSVERHIDQVADGTAYTGYVKIGKSKLDYELKFTVSIPGWETMQEPKDKAEARKVWQIAIKKDGSDVPLTDDEWSFFFSMLVMYAAEFYYLPQTRDNNESPILGPALSGKPHRYDHIANYSIGATKTDTFKFGSKLCLMLNAPKFGCKLAA